ncbi:MAG: type II toxin-antitoxin system RelE/ParE family toxin [Hyphomicrobiales bacterium]|nr:type II toxin-antitoxin system RelE/ParE family toxin [Hyphomicrobiales bacterium]
MLSADERDAVIAAIARVPEGGDLIPGTGGLRKRRIPLPGRGKRGGARVITLYLGDHVPVYAVFILAKNEREDMSAEQRRLLMRLVGDIKASARVRVRG